MPENTDTIRTYETYAIVWTNDDGSESTWTNYEREHAEATIAWAADHGSRPGRLVRSTFEVRIPASHRALYQGAYIAERDAETTVAA
jgi:hypothetical protein